MFELRYIPDVVTLELDASKCTGCGMCVDVCPHAVLAIENGTAEIVDRDACMECGACEMNCPPGAISVRSGVGCAAAVITGAVRGTEPACDCGDGGDDGTSSCCG
jgi:ferredoxin